MKICFTGDVFLGGDLLNKSAADVIRSSAFQNADFRVINLEQPISDNGFAEDKCTLLSGSFAMTQLKEMGVNVVNLAHNHIQDAGDDGIIETINHLQSVGIESFGAGGDILRAGKPVWIDENLAVLGYCEYGKSYLRQIRLADEGQPGVNPLCINKINHDLDALPVGKKAVLYFHWGREHVWLPPVADIELAKSLLNDDRVALIVGMHPHRAQGYIEHNGKRAYMCLGNFLFPNFFIAPPTQICYPSIVPKNVSVTRQYHSVHKITYKKWRLANRVSIILEYDSAVSKVDHHFVIQDDKIPEVHDLRGFGGRFMNAFIACLSMIYRLPPRLYVPLERVSAFLATYTWRAQIFLFKLRQLGLFAVINKIMAKLNQKRIG
jgi:poly-gamma-glutamate synthesis protein (capsule biosynthesis protein)